MGLKPLNTKAATVRKKRKSLKILSCLHPRLKKKSLPRSKA